MIQTNTFNSFHPKNNLNTDSPYKELEYPTSPERNFAINENDNSNILSNNKKKSF